MNVISLWFIVETEHISTHIDYSSVIVLLISIDCLVELLAGTFRFSNVGYLLSVIQQKWHMTALILSMDLIVQDTLFSSIPTVLLPGTAIME